MRFFLIIILVLLPFHYKEAVADYHSDVIRSACDYLQSKNSLDNETLKSCNDLIPGGYPASKAESFHLDFSMAPLGTLVCLEIDVVAPADFDPIKDICGPTTNLKYVDRAKKFFVLRIKCASGGDVTLTRDNKFHYDRCTAEDALRSLAKVTAQTYLTKP